MDQVDQRTAANRRLLAEFFDTLDQDQLSTRSLCEAWTVREVLGHTVVPFTVGIGGILWRTLRERGSVLHAMETASIEVAQQPVPHLTGLLRRNAERRVPAPGVGPMGQMTDCCVHLRDCARPLDLDTDVELADWRMVLDWLPTKQASRGVVPRGRLEGLRLRATDQDWSWGSGAEMAGSSEALAMAVAGRKVAVADLEGRGVEILASRLSS
ncbi:maleylpyruvate isomerase family mycothiol-dependent enzyme [Nesterenkonia ebinurensis]|uniref:maleylpyruvate isomerase family mycothiol-dependent enzyme n=1 Tax=Nesterenkonia ebinurensis TaxID=2608252 RepID=UPI00123D92D5|nr:maleylpyruvate isomerase family mycothiol-dependent enzyme [Nesterenkonia ebinurensis]